MSQIFLEMSLKRFRVCFGIQVDWLHFQARSGSAEHPNPASYDYSGWKDGGRLSRKIGLKYFMFSLGLNLPFGYISMHKLRYSRRPIA